ncbi:SRPBCC family protein [Nocardioides sp. Kera G14]|uniref:SRPBCC family protein n=1 Tax=Nocardioides sp. Kera G14 TaxID=2884264 RepID=UPI001D11C2AE|nr:SRPBCC family protein [Nocardioides sp. Kera G14]UDY24970.1 SRPBCC family protein [Nocardioides sp. Kera G14]
MPAFATSRSTTIDADIAAVHALINDFRQWPQWSPWEKIDPALTRSYDGPDAGTGAHYAWEGKKAGSGTMTITLSTADAIAIDLEFVKPFKASNKVIFTLRPTGPATEVTWTMSGERNLAFTVLGKLFFDRAIGKDFDKGLADLKAAAERG